MEPNTTLVSHKVYYALKYFLKSIYDAFCDISGERHYMYLEIIQQ